MVQSDWSTASKAVTQDLEFYQSSNWGWDVEYHNNFTFRLFYRKQNDKNFYKTDKLPYFGVLLVKIQAKM